MNDFFEPPLPEPEPEPFRPPVWHGPPSNVLGGFVPVRVVLARTDRGFLAVEELTAYPTGFAFAVVVRARRSEEEPLEDWDPFFPRPRRRVTRSSGIAPEVLRFGIQFSDGSKATNLRPSRPVLDESPSLPVLIPLGGGGGDTEWRQRYWVWPIPSPGPLAFVCEWPAHGIPFTRVEIDAGLILEAAKEAETLWQVDQDQAAGSAAGYTAVALSSSKMQTAASRDSTAGDQSTSENDDSSGSGGGGTRPVPNS